jgi:hypothetical protein
LYNIFIECGNPLKLVKLINMCLNETYKESTYADISVICFELRVVCNKEIIYCIVFQLCFRLAIKRLQANQEDLKLNSTHQLLVCANDVNILCGSMHNMKKNTSFSNHW